jgi:nucleoside permease NupC
MLTPAGLVVALILSAPALWEAANGSLSLGVAMLRLLAALVLVAVGTAVLRRVMAPQRPMAPPVADEVSSAANHGRRRDDS